MKALRGLFAGLLLAVLIPSPGQGQKVTRIEALVSNNQFLPAIEGFRKRMAELGYKEGGSIEYNVHNAVGNSAALNMMAVKIVESKPDVIVTSSTTATEPIAKATAGTAIPVVFLSAGNPLKFVHSYSSSGNNLTGISTSSIDLTGKRMELLLELVPGAKKVITLHNPTGANYKANLAATREAGKQLGVDLVEINVNSRDELVRAARARLFTREVGDGIVLAPDGIINSGVDEIMPYINREELPSIAVNSEFVKAGALATYASDYFDLGEQGAALVHKVLSGMKPTDLPIEQPYKLKLVINLKTARVIGLKIPRAILLRASEVFE
jgi:putative tryptophan/tyrosine transport system substrate-binding protein